MMATAYGQQSPAINAPGSTIAITSSSVTSKSDYPKLALERAGAWSALQFIVRNHGADAFGIYIRNTQCGDVNSIILSWKLQKASLLKGESAAAYFSVLNKKDRSWETVSNMASVLKSFTTVKTPLFTQAVQVVCKTIHAQEWECISHITYDRNADENNAITTLSPECRPLDPN